MTEDPNKKSSVMLSDPTEISGIPNEGFATKLVNELYGSFFFHQGAAHDHVIQQVNTAVDFVKSFKPQDAVEAQLLVQMASAHNVAMESLRRANIADQTFAGRDMGLKYAAKFMNLYMEQMRCLNKHRGKGDQKVIIEHINIESGAQAIVGHVTHDPGNKDGRKNIPQETLHALEPRMSMKKGKTPTAGKKKSSE